MKTPITSLLICLLATSAQATVPAGETIRQSFVCNGSTVAFTFTAPSYSADDIYVYTHLIATGVEELLTVSSQYTIAATDSDYINGGVVTTVATYASTYRIVVVRNLQKTQDTVRVAMSAQAAVDAVDKLSRIVQDLEDRVNRSIRLQESDATTFDMELPGLALRASSYPFFGTDGALTMVNSVASDNTVVSTFMETVVDDADGRAGLTTLGGIAVENVVTHGADPTGVADCTSAVQAAISASQTTAIQYAGALTTTSRAGIFFPEGVYKIDSAITADIDNTIQYLEFFGNKAQLVIAAGVTAFGGIGTETHFRDLTFHGGAVAISIKTNNLDTSKITIDNCIFVAETVNCIQADDGSNSTLLNIDDCKFLENTTAGMHILDTGSIDIVNMSRCWSSGSPAIPIEASGARLNLTECQFFPRGITAWINQTGAAVRLDRCILSGEDGGGCFVDFRATAGTLQVENCSLFSNDAAVRFYAMPKSFKWNNNQGTLGTQSEGGDQTGGFWFSPDLSQSDVNDVWNNDSQYLVEGFQPFDTNDAELADITKALQVEIDQTPSQPLDTDLVLVIPSNEGGLGSNTSRVNITETAAVAEPIFGIETMTLLATSTDSSYQRRWGTALNGLAVGNYTYVRFIRVEDESTIRLQIRAGERSATIRDFGQGYHVVCMPFHFQTNEMVGMVVTNFRNGDTVWLGPIRIYSGYHVINTINDVRWGDTIPTTLNHFIGDRVVNSDPDAGESVGWTCVTAGEPGTWIPYGMIQSANAYTTSNVSTDRTLDADATSTAEIADVLATLIEDLKTSGLLKSP